MRKKYVCVHGCKSYVVGLGIKVMWYAWVLTGWNAWTVVSQKGMRHNPKTVLRQIPPAIPGTYGRMILSVV